MSLSISTASRSRALVAYYDETWPDYCSFWLNPETLALHFGYWRKDTQTHANSLINMNREMAARANLQVGQIVLDAGCGVGGTAIWLAQKYCVRVIGVTNVPNQVTRAQRFARERIVSDLVHFKQKDYCKTDFPDATFDVVWAQESICHCPHKPLFFAEAFRLLKPGGCFIMAEYLRSRRRFCRKDEYLLHRWLSGWEIPDLATSEEFTTWIKNAGFECLRVEDITPQVRPSLRILHDIALDNFPLAVVLHLTGFRSDTQMANIRGARLQWAALERGLWFYAFLSARKQKL